MVESVFSLWLFEWIKMCFCVCICFYYESVLSQFCGYQLKTYSCQYFKGLIIVKFKHFDNCRLPVVTNSHSNICCLQNKAWEINTRYFKLFIHNLL